MAADLDRLTVAASFGITLLVLGVVDSGLDALERARERVELRRFLREHTEVTWYWTDGT